MLVGRKTTDDPTVTELPWVRGVPGLKRLTLRLESALGYQDLYNPRFRALARLVPPETDIIHLHGLYPGRCFADLGALPRLSRRWPLVLSLHDMTLLTGHCGYASACTRWRVGCGRCPDLGLPFAIRRDGTRLNWWRKRWYLRRSRPEVTACSQWLVDAAAQSPIFRGRCIHLLHNAVDTEVFRPASRLDARSRFGLATEAFVVAVVANGLRNPWKGVPDAMAALNTIAAKTAVMALVVGDDPEVAARLDVPHSATGYIRDRSLLAEAYRAADVLLMPSTEEAFGMVAAEAMACETPVVAYASGGLPEVVGSAEECGILVATRDVGGLAGALLTLASDPERRRGMGRNAAARSRCLFGMDCYITRVLQIYRHAIDKRRQPAGPL